MRDELIRKFKENGIPADRELDHAKIVRPSVEVCGALRLVTYHDKVPFGVSFACSSSLIRANLFSDVNNRSGRMSLPIIRAPAFGNWNQTRDGDVYVANYR
jgi:hypothetical protein